MKEFTTLTLEIPNLFDKNSLFFFIDGLKDWARTELKRREMQDLATTISKALVDYSEKKEPSKSRDRRGGSENSRGDYGNKTNDGACKPLTGKPQYKGNNQKPLRTNCLFCDGPIGLGNVQKGSPSMP